MMPLGLGCAKLTAFSEEGLEDSGAVSGENAGGDFHLMVEARVREDIETGADGAAFGIIGAVDQTWDTRLDDGACAHATGLDGDVKRGVGEAVVAKNTCSFAKDNNFGVGRRVVVANRAVAGTGENLAVMDKHGTDWDFAGGSCVARFGKSLLHELGVTLHLVEVVDD